MAERFWSDDLDIDLPKLLPTLDEHLGDAAGIPLWTYGGTSYGRLNHPSVWNSYDGSVAFFGTDDTGDWKPAEYYTEWPMVGCTWREVVRDAWPHHYTVVLDDRPLWSTSRMQGTFTRLMYDLRGWQLLADGEADRLRGEALASVIAATRDLRQRVGAVTA